MAQALDPNWQSQIPARSLERGLVYANADKVDHVDRVAHGWEATVYGSAPYRVFVPDADYGTVGERATCTCPWFEGGNMCKHIAAVCFTLEGKGASMSMPP